MNTSQQDPTDRRGMFYWQVDRPFTPFETKSVFLDRYDHFDSKDAIPALEYGLRQCGFDGNDVQVLSVRPPGKILSSVNILYYATLKSGREVIIRIHPKETKNGYFHAESVASSRAKHHGVPSYDSYYIDDTRSHFPFDYMITERLPGDTMQLLWPIPVNEDKIYIEETGAFLARIHEVNTIKYGFFDNIIARDKKQLTGIHDHWKDHVFASYDKNLQFLTDTSVLANDQRKKIENIFSTHDSVITCPSPRLIHNDIADWNQLVKHGHVTGIVDWDECFSGDPVMDFAAWSVFFPFERMQHLVRGYQTVAQLPEGYDEKLHLYRLRYIISKSVSRKTKIMVTPNIHYAEMLAFAMKILEEELQWYGM